MTPIARPIRVLIVSPDVAVLHDLAWMLTAVGYAVETSKDLSENAAWRRLNEADVLIVDGRSIAEPSCETLALQSDYPVYRYVLYDQTTASKLTTWLAAGVHDALRLPLSRGELLARTRIAARAMEFERRLQAQSQRSRILGLLSTRGFLRRLRTLNVHSKSEHTLLAVAIDFFQGAIRKEGTAAAERALSALATAIQQSAGDQAIVAYTDHGALQVLLAGHSPEQIRLVAERIAELFQTLQQGSVTSVPLSLSIAIVPWKRGDTPEQLLEHGRETLIIAKQSGGDCIIDQSAYAQELSTWQNELTVGSPFASLIAQDIMEPFPYVLKHDLPNSAIVSALRRSEIPIWPFVNAEGRLVGVATPSKYDETAAGHEHAGERFSLLTPTTIAHDAAFPEIYEAFSTNGCLEMVVVADHRPIGYLTLGGFTSLIEPIDTATYARAEGLAEDLESLMVGAHVSGSEPESDFDR